MICARKAGAPDKRRPDMKMPREKARVIAFYRALFFDI